MGFLGSLLSGLGDVVGLIPGVGPEVKAGASLLGGALGSSITESDNLANQKELMQMNQSWQSEENEKNRQYQSDEWTRQFDLVNAYNDPQAVSKRLRNAGINPNVAFDKGTSIAGSSASPSAPSGGVSMSPSPDYSGIITSGYQSMESLARRIKIMSEARGQDITNEYTGALLDSQIQKNLATYESETAKADFTKFQLQLEKQFGRLQRSKQLAKLESDILLQYQQGQLAVQQGKYYDMAAFNQAAEALLNYARKNLTEQQATQLEIDIKYEAARIKSEISRNYGAAAAGYGVADQTHENAETERQLRQWKVAISSSQAQLDMLKRDVAIENKDAYAKSVLAEWKAKELLTDEQYYKVIEAAANADNIHKKILYDNMLKLAESIESGSRTVKNVAESGNVLGMLLSGVGM